MPNFRTAEQAYADLFEISAYISRDDPAAAQRLLDRIGSVCDLLASTPLMGRTRPDLPPELRAFPVGRYLILYRPTSDGVEIVRVVHGARYLPGLI